MAKTKVCTKCRKRKRVEQFHKRKRGDHYSKCKVCMKERSKAYYDKCKADRKCPSCGKPIDGPYNRCNSCYNGMLATNKRRYKKKKKTTTCVFCNKLAVDGKVMCKSCATKSNESTARKRKRYKDNGVCTHCGKKRDNETMECNKCKNEKSRRTRKRYRKRKKLGICVSCGRPAIKGLAHCDDCLIDHKNYRINNVPKSLENQWAKNSRRRIREAILNGYGGKCAHCGEDHHEFLELDHVNNDGAKDKQKGLTGGYRLYKHAIKYNFPKKYQLLCANCNLKKKLANAETKFRSRKRGYKYKKCPMCGKRRDISNMSRGICKYCMVRLRRKYYIKLREKVLSMYGNKCECCRMDDKDVLQLHHANHDGKKARRKIGPGFHTYVWAIKKYRWGFEVLCRNCHMSIHRYGYCPHDLEHEQRINEMEHEEAFLQV